MVVVFLLLILLGGTHLMLVLQKRSMVHAVATELAGDLAREASLSDDELSVKAIRLLDDRQAKVTRQPAGADVILLTVDAKSPSLFGGPFAELANVSQTVRVRQEKLRETP